VRREPDPVVAEVADTVRKAGRVDELRGVLAADAELAMSAPLTRSLNSTLGIS
jgi:hypothetical protein